MEKNKLIMIIGVSFIAGLIGTFIGYQIGIRNIAQQDEVIIKEKILKEIDQKVEEKIRIGTLPLMIMPEQVAQERRHVHGEVVSQDIPANRFQIKLFNQFEGGSFTEFIFQPTYFTKEIVLMPETKVRKFVMPLMDPMMMEDKMMDPMFWEPEEKQLSIAELQEIITAALEAEEPLYLNIETKEAFILGQVEPLTATQIDFHAEE